MFICKGCGVTCIGDGVQGYCEACQSECLETCDVCGKSFDSDLIQIGEEQQVCDACYEQLTLLVAETLRSD